MCRWPNHHLITVTVSSTDVVVVVVITVIIVVLHIDFVLSESFTEDAENRRRVLG